MAPQPFYQERGTPIAVRMLLEVLRSDGHAVDLLTYHEGGDPGIVGLRIFRTPGLPGLRKVPIGISWQKLLCDVLLCARLIGLCLTRQYDVIHAVEESIFPVILLRHISRARIVYDMDSALADQLLTRWTFLRPMSRSLARLERAAMRRSDAVFAACIDLAASASAAAPAVPVFLIEDVALPAQNKNGPPERLRDNPKIRGAILLYVGNLHRSQGVEQLIEGMSLLPRDCEATLVVIGGAPDAITRMRNLARQLSVEDKVVLLGPRPLENLGSYLTSADVLVSPRLQGNNTPMKIYSYMKSGVAILATRIPAHTQVLDEQCAHLVESNPQALAQGILFLLNDADSCARLSAAAKTRVAERYSFESFRDKVRAAYRTLEPTRPSGDAEAVRE